MKPLNDATRRGRFTLGFAAGVLVTLGIVLLAAAQQEGDAPAPEPPRQTDPFAGQNQRPARFLLAIDPATPFDGTLVGISGQFVALRRIDGVSTEIYPAQQVITIWLQPEERRSRQVRPPQPQQQEPNRDENDR